MSATLSTGLTPTGVVGTGWSCSSSGQQVSCTHAALLAPGAALPVLTIEAAVAATAASTATLNAQLTTPGDEVTGNDTAQDTANVSGAFVDLSVSQTASGSFAVEGTGSYRLQIHNAGSLPTTQNFTVTDELPFGVVAESASGSAASWMSRPR